MVLRNRGFGLAMGAAFWAALLVTGTAAAQDRGHATLEPAGWDTQLKLSEPKDLSPDPRILEINLEARVARVEIGPGLAVDAWTYDGGLPGPLIRLSVGDRLIVHFTNHLPEPTTVHWHGLRIPIDMDGVPGISQPFVEPGGMFTYDFVVPDAGLFWYHPHVSSAEQVGFGLYGPLLVEDPADRASVGVADELVIVLSDIGVDEDGRLEDPESGGSTGMAFGREGNHVLVNGRLGALATLKARAGVPQRWRIVNAAKSRYFALDLDGHAFTKIGSDGGLMEYPVVTNELVVATAERADVIVTPSGEPGATIPFRSLIFDRGYGSFEFRTFEEPLFSVALVDEPAYIAPALPELRREIEPLSTEGATAVQVDLTLAQLTDGTFEYGINGMPYWKAPPFTSGLSETQVWTLTNKTAWSHPFHLHGFFFQVLDDSGRPVRPLEWKDTVSVPYQQTRRVVVRFDDRPGAWMFHCHILDHADGGLMGVVRVGLPPTDEHLLIHPHTMKY